MPRWLIWLGVAIIVLAGVLFLAFREEISRPSGPGLPSTVLGASVASGDVAMVTVQIAGGARNEMVIQLRCSDPHDVIANADELQSKRVGAHERQAVFNLRTIAGRSGAATVTASSGPERGGPTGVVTVRE